MASVIKLKRGSGVPAALQEGEIAVDTVGRKLYVGPAGGGAGQEVHGGRLNGAIVFTANGYGSALPLGVLGYLPLPFAATITSWRLLAAQAGSLVLDIWKDTYANYPPVAADVITATAKPTLSATNKNVSATLTGWNTAIAAGDVLAFNLNSTSGVITMLTLELGLTRT